MTLQQYPTKGLVLHSLILVAGPQKGPRYTSKLMVDKEVRTFCSPLNLIIRGLLKPWFSDETNVHLL